MNNLPLLPNVAIGVFAHNEERNIARTISTLARQTLVTERNTTNIDLFILVNGCRDATAAAASQAIKDNNLSSVTERSGVIDLVAPGKSKTWNSFVHDLANQEVDFFVFMDADIELPDQATLSRLVQFLVANPEVNVATSRPTKTVESGHARTPLDWMSRQVSRLSQGNAIHSIAGSLYCMRATLARRLVLPEGLLGEDGFVRIASSTLGFQSPPDDRRILRVPDAFHVFTPCRTLVEYLLHERRLMIGTLQNFAIWAWIRSQPALPVPSQRIRELNSNSPNWTHSLLRDHVEKIGRAGILHHVWSRALGQLRSQRGIRQLLMFPVFAGRLFFSGLAGLMAIRAIRKDDIRW